MALHCIDPGEIGRDEVIAAALAGYHMSPDERSEIREGRLMKNPDIAALIRATLPD